MAQLGDVSIHYVVSGHGPILFYTTVGWGLSTVTYQHAFKPLEKHFTMVYVEVRGNGKSSLPSDLNHMDQADFAADIDHLRVYLGLDRINLMGHSGGGSITLEYA
jgi:pimeloyl-ACP methyl ester carboxylesterase